MRLSPFILLFLSCFLLYFNTCDAFWGAILGGIRVAALGGVRTVGIAGARSATVAGARSASLAGARSASLAGAKSATLTGARSSASFAPKVASSLSSRSTNVGSSTSLLSSSSRSSSVVSSPFLNSRPVLSPAKPLVRMPLPVSKKTLLTGGGVAAAAVGTGVLIRTQTQTETDGENKKRKLEPCKTSIYVDHKKVLLVKNNEILYPSDDEGHIIIAHGDTVTFACPSSYILPLGGGYDVIDAECERDDIYKYGGREYHARDLQCYQTPSPTDKDGGKCLNNRYKAIDIGFQVRTNFIKHINVCFDNEKKSVLYTRAILHKKLCCCQITDRVDFRIGNFFTRELGDKYSIAIQSITLSDILAGGRGYPRYFKSDNLLQAGHLVAKCDFVYAAQQKLTFYYINAAPQFATFNGRNWRMVEDKIRAFIRNQRTNLEVYTGTYGVLQLPDTNNRKVPLYLNHNPRTNTYQIPVPEFFWKVVIQRTGSLTRGLAILGMNDVYNFDPSELPCTNVLSRATWLRIPRRSSVENGYIIACEVSEFQNISGLKDQLPNFPVIHANLY